MAITERPQGANGSQGALRVHQAADGGLARIRLAGGRLTADQLRSAIDAAATLGDGTLELTSRANLRIRALGHGVDAELTRRLSAVGLLPSATHERVRNIVASPLSGLDGAGQADLRPLIGDLDAMLCEQEDLAELPTRFLFALDDGRGDVAWRDADIAALFVSDDTAAILLGGEDSKLRPAGWQVWSVMLACAKIFLDLREGEWRVSELGGRVAAMARQYFGRAESTSALRRPPQVTVGPLGRIAQVDGRESVGVAAPLGRLDSAQALLLSDLAPNLVITPWRGVVVPDLAPGTAEHTLGLLASAGLIVDPAGPGVGVTACTGRPRCARALADVRTDAAVMLTDPAGPAVHWSGCERRCGRPQGEVLDVVATTGGYLVGGESVILEYVAGVVGMRRRESR